jgi:hypothetical protein
VHCCESPNYSYVWPFFRKTTQPRTPSKNRELHILNTLCWVSHATSSLVLEDEGVYPVRWSVVRSLLFCASSGVSVSSLVGDQGESEVTGRISACATPPKKSVIRVLLRSRRNRSVRTPKWELILAGSMSLN